MTVYDGLEAIQSDITPFCPDGTVVCAGVFDGVHLGHQSLIKQTVEISRQHGFPSVVFTFDRHPGHTIAPGSAPAQLTSIRSRVSHISDLGPDCLVAARFDKRFRELSAESFCRFVLGGILGVKLILVGEDFRFGFQQMGNVCYLEDAGKRLGFSVTAIRPVEVDNERVSSSRIRAALAHGDVDKAKTYLGRPYRLQGTVVHGDHLGRTLGYPTANLACDPISAIPANGIYAGFAIVNDVKIPSAISLGTRPHFNGTEQRIEAHLIDFEADLYGATVAIEFVNRLRGEERFTSDRDLIEQIGKDVTTARVLLNSFQP